MIKEVFNSIRNGADASHLQLVGKNDQNNTAESQGFFGKMFMALKHQEHQNQQVEEQNSDWLSAEESETKEGREAVKQALLNLMNSQEPARQLSNQNQLNKNTGVTNSGLNAKNPEEISALKLIISENEQPVIENTENQDGELISEVEIQNNPLKAAVADHQKIVKQNQSETSENKMNVPAATGQEGDSEISLSTQSENRPVNGTVISELDKNIKATLNTELHPMNSGEVSGENFLQETSKGDPKAQVETVILKQEQVAVNEISQKAAKTDPADLLKRQSPKTASVVQEVEQNKPPLFTAKEAVLKEGTAQNERILQQFQQMSQKQVSKDELNGQMHIQNEIKAQQANEERSKRYDLYSRNSDGKSITGDRLEAASGAGASGSNLQESAFSSTPNWLRFQSVFQSKGGELTDQQQTILNEQVNGVAENPDDGSAERAKNGMHRLGEIPVQNALLRRSVLPGLSSILQKATSSGKELTQNWQKHSFELDDGKKIELSTRNVDGVIQLKIASSNLELSKLLQQYGQEIREHLEKECELNIDLQFSDDQDDSLDSFFGDSASAGKDSSGISTSGTAGNQPAEADKQTHQSVRRFGYNQMEWTV